MRALALVESPDHVCGRYRIRAFLPALSAAGWSLTVEGLAHGAIARIRQFRRAEPYDAVILQRKLLPTWQLKWLRAYSRRLLFDFDDAVLFRDSYDPRGPHCRRRLSRFTSTMRLVDTVLAGNDFLVDCALRAGADPLRLRVIPTCVDTTRLLPRAAPHPPGRGLDLVWIGSSSTLQGLVQQRSLLERIGREIPGTRLRLICDRFPTFDSLEVIPIPWSEATEARELAAGDVGISWVPDDLWSRGKCGLKLLQYRACGLAVVTNPVGVHLRIVLPGEDGFLAEHADEWLEAIRKLSMDADLRSQMGQRARRATEVDYSLAAWSDAFVAALAGHPAPAPPQFAGASSVLASLVPGSTQR